MSTAPKRPNLARKVTPATEKSRNSMLDLGVKITYEGVVYEVRAGDLNALDSQALRRELGLSFMGLITSLSTDPDIDLIAGVVWLGRRTGGERSLSYAEVAEKMGYDALDGLEVEEIKDAEKPSPEG